MLDDVYIPQYQCVGCFCVVVGEEPIQLTVCEGCSLNDYDDFPMADCRDVDCGQKEIVFVCVDCDWSLDDPYYHND